VQCRSEKERIDREAALVNAKGQGMEAVQASETSVNTPVYTALQPTAVRTSSRVSSEPCYRVWCRRYFLRLRYFYRW
jgi:hypothetical protein